VSKYHLKHKPKYSTYISSIAYRKLVHNMKLEYLLNGEFDT